MYFVGGLPTIPNREMKVGHSFKSNRLHLQESTLIVLLLYVNIYMQQ